MPGSVEAYGQVPSGGLVQILQDLTSARMVAVDTETVSLEDKSMIGLALAPNPDYAVWFSEDSPYLHIALSILRDPKVTKLFHNCVPISYRALTKNGFKSWKELSIGDYVMGYNQNLNVCYWTKILDIIPPKPMVMVSFGNKRIKLRATKNHRWYGTKTTSYPKYEQCSSQFTTQELLKDKIHSITLSAPCINPGELSLSTEEVKIIAWILTDGNINWKGNSPSTFINQSINSPFLEDIIELTKEYTTSIYKQKYCGLDEVWRFHLNANMVRRLYHKAHLLDWSLEKFILALSPENRRVFMDTVHDAEGWEVGNTKLISQNNGEKLDCFQLGAFLEGYSPHINREYRKNRVLTLKRPILSGQHLKKFAESEEDGWCITTESGNWIAKGDGEIFITGNSKFDFDVLEPFGIDETNFEDSLILAYTLNLPQKLYNLGAYLGKQVPAKFFNFEFPKTRGYTNLDLWNSDPDFLLQKCCVDASLTYWCWEKLKSQIVESYYIDRNVVHSLRHMEHMGVRINQESVAEFYYELDEQVTYLRQLIQTKGCDPNSNQQIGIALAQKGWRLPYTKSKKQLKVNEKTLQNIDDPLAQSVLVYREKAKVLSTYIKPLLGLERAYTHYNNTRVITGRLSSSDPINMQNIPLGIRVVFLADDGSLVFALDASQIELRTLAYLAQDKVMLAAFASGRDIHRETMDKMGITANMSNQVEARRLAKILNFATAYLGEEETIIENAKKEGIRITPMQATDFRHRYFETYTGIRDYVYNQREWIINYGYVQTLFGRVRRVDPIRMANPHSRESVIREMFNMPVQGTAAEIIKKMMARVVNYDLRIQVHDEMIFDGKCPPISLFTGLAPFETPLTLKVGESWGDMREIKIGGV